MKTGNNEFQPAYDYCSRELNGAASFLVEMSEEETRKPLMNVPQRGGYSSISVNRSSFYRSPSNETSNSITLSQPATYSWENIEVYRQNKSPWNACIQESSPRRQILNSVTGAVCPGEFLAIMGASGAGKTTLLNCLTFRKNRNLSINGQRYLNGQKVNKDLLTRISGYVQQDDLFISTLKVREHLLFQATLRMSQSFSYEERVQRVNEVIQEMGLSKCENTVIGNPERGIKGISGGERKRLAFASEILTNPSLLFCDEPTSALDSFMAKTIVQILKDLASTGKTVIITIHQPSSDVFAMFDRLLLMAEGRTAFLGQASQALHFFSAHVKPCPANYNPADYYINLLASVPGREVECSAQINEICDAYEASEIAKKNVEIVKSNRPSAATGSDIDVEVKLSPYKSSWFAQFRAVFWRSAVSITRERAVLKVKLFQTLSVSILLALVYQGQKRTFANVTNVQGVLFMFLTNMTFQHVLGVVNVITSELPIFLREHVNGMYRTDVYYLAKTLADLPVYIIYPLIFISIPYFIIELNPEIERFFIAYGILVLVSNSATSFGYLISCLTSSTSVALALIGPLIVPLLLFGGFVVRLDSVQSYLHWMSYLSWFKYGYEALSINQWKGVTFQDPDCMNNGTCTFESIFQTLDLKTGGLYFDIVGLVALIVGYRVLAFIALLSKTYR